MFKLKSKLFYGVVVTVAALVSFMPAAQAKVFSVPTEDAIATINAPDACAFHYFLTIWYCHFNTFK